MSIDVGDWVTADIPQQFRLSWVDAGTLATVPHMVMAVEHGGTVLAVGPDRIRVLKNWCTLADPFAVEPESPGVCACDIMRLSAFGHDSDCPERPAMTWHERARRGLV